MRAVETYLESCADIKVDVGVLERLIEPEEEKVCLRYILKYSTRRGNGTQEDRRSLGSGEEGE